MRADQVLADDTDRANFGGMSVRKGTIAAFLMNAKAWSDPAIDEDTRKQVEVDILEAIPALRAVGLFEIFSVKDPRLAEFMSCA